MDLRALAAIAHKEVDDATRSRGVWALAALLTGLPLLVSVLGLGLSGRLVPQGFARTTASMISLSIYLVPLLGLQLSQASVVGEAERGTLRCLAAQPIPRWTIVLGKFLGSGAMLALLLTISFGFAGGFIALRAGLAQGWDYVAFTVSAVVLGLIFVAIGLALSTAARDRTQALAGAMGTWFFFCVVEDLLLLAAFVALSRVLIAPDYAPATEVLHRELASGWTGDEARFPWLSALVLLNPTGVFRLWNVLRTPAMRETLALTRSMPAWLASPWTLFGVTMLWLGAPLGLAIRRFERAELE